MKLYVIPKGSRIKAVTTDENGQKKGDFVIFHHLDGLFSYWTVEGTEDVCHLAVNQDLTLSEEGYYELS